VKRKTEVEKTCRNAMLHRAFQSGCAGVRHFQPPSHPLHFQGSCLSSQRFLISVNTQLPICLICISETFGFWTSLPLHPIDLFSVPPKQPSIHPPFRDIHSAPLSICPTLLKVCASCGQISRLRGLPEPSHSTGIQRTPDHSP
jgi:hypothetical protein